MVAKTDQSVLLSCRMAYESGDWKSVSELARRFGIHLKTLHGRIEREGWNKKREEVTRKLEKKIEQKTLSGAESYLSSLTSRVKRYEKIIDASIENLGSKTAEGIPLLDPEAIDQYTRSEGRLKEIGFAAHRIATAVDVTSNGQSLGAGLVQAIESMRAGKTIEISPETYQAALDANTDSP